MKIVNEGRGKVNLLKGSRGQGFEGSRANVKLMNENIERKLQLPAINSNLSS